MTIEAHGNKVSGFFCGYTDDREHHDRLLPCPFCGTKADLEIGNTHTPWFFVACRNCGVEVAGCTPQRKRGGKILTPSSALRLFTEAMELAIAQWNTRAQPCASQGCGEAGSEAVWSALRWCAAALQALIDSRGESGSINMIVSGEKKSLEEVLDLADAALSTAKSGGAE